MAENLDRFEKDLDRLVEMGKNLQFTFIMSAYGKDIGRNRLNLAGISKETIDIAEKDSASLIRYYQSWYSESISVIKQLLPDRLKDFRDLYERPANRKEIDFLTYVISDAMIGLTTSKGGATVADSTAAFPKFQAQVSILASVKTRFKSSLFEIRQLVQADLFDSEIESARHLLENKYLRAAGAVAGVVLEKHLQQVCRDHYIKITKKNPTIGDLNESLKASSVISVPQWRHITLLGDIRNICDHKKTLEPTSDQVSDLIEGTDKVLKTIS